MNSIDYWNRRNNLLNSVTNKSIKVTEMRIQREYQLVYERLERDALKIMEEYQSKLAEGQVPGQAMIHSLQRMNTMMEQLRSEVEGLGYSMNKTLQNSLYVQYKTIYDSVKVQSAKLEPYSKLNKRYILDRINTPWVTGDPLTFSSRIWGNTNKLMYTLQEDLTTALATGQKTDKLIAKLQHDFGVSYNEASRLVRTESAHIQTQATMDKYKKYGVEKFNVQCGPDCCDDCADISDNGPYDTDAFDIMPPIHPNCRCTITAVVDTDSEVESNE